jgi:ribosomal-protein-alanine N-acetyltransferase
MLETERLKVRPLRKSDYKDIHEYMSAPETFRFERGKPASIKESQKFCREFSAKKPTNFWVAELKANRKVIGHVSFFPEKPPEFKTWNIGYIFHPKYYRQGYATEATRAVIKFAFTELNAHRIVAYCGTENVASWKVLEKCNMRKEGLMKKNFLHHQEKNGKEVWFDSYCYAILNEEFR